MPRADACAALEVDAAGLESLWVNAKKTKFGGGFCEGGGEGRGVTAVPPTLPCVAHVALLDCGVIESPSRPAPVFVFNAFFMAMR